MKPEDRWAVELDGYEHRLGDLISAYAAEFEAEPRPALAAFYRYAASIARDAEVTAATTSDAGMTPVSAKYPQWLILAAGIQPPAWRGDDR